MSNEIENTESQLESEMDASSDTAETAETKVKPNPAWEAFSAALTAEAQALGLTVKEQKGFVQFVNASTGHKLYVARQSRSVKRIDTTLPVLGQDGTYPLEKPNGKIECHIEAKLETVSHYLSMLADGSVGKIRPSKRAPKAATETPAAE